MNNTKLSSAPTPEAALEDVRKSKRGDPVEPVKAFCAEPVAANDMGPAVPPNVSSYTPPTSPIPGMTPAGIQSTAVLTRRRVFVASLALALLSTLLVAVHTALNANGMSAFDWGILACVALSAPWIILGVINAGLGLAVLHGRKNSGDVIGGYLAAADAPTPLSSRTALLMTLRNEDPDRSIARLRAMVESLDEAHALAHYDVFILSDSSEPAIIEREAHLANWLKLDFAGRTHVTYRCRTDNAGFKAGNIRDFLDRWGDNYTFMVTLDADSLMTGREIARLTRVMEAYPRLGILQSLVVGMPSLSPFARTFQFGMRHGMRAFTMGSAWWAGDCGPYWGHNAILRIAPFRDHCRLPTIPGTSILSGHVLSHDQVEAALMRRAGYEVRVVPFEGESYEENPPTVVEFTKRDLRWCQGNMQYLWLLKTPGLLPLSRFQLFAAIMMYMGAPAWMLMTVLAAAKLATGDLEVGDQTLGITLFFTMFLLSFAPKLAGLLDLALTNGGARRYGGSLRFGLSALFEALFMMLLAPALAFRVTLFLIGLPFGQSATWNGQQRDAHELSWATAVSGLWPQAVFGTGLLAIIVSISPDILPWAAPFIFGLMFAIPLAVVSSSPALGRWMAARKICAIPEEFETGTLLARLQARERREAEATLNATTGPSTTPNTTSGPGLVVG